jgi:membrane dipeptidase
MSRRNPSLLVVCAAVNIIAGSWLAEPADARDSPSPEACARQSLAEAPLIDGHNDLAIRLRERLGGIVSELDFQHGTDTDPRWQTDIAALRKGGVGGQFWSVYVPSSLSGDAAVRATLEQIDIVKRIIGANADDLAFATSASDIERAQTQGKIASLVGAEGGHAIGGSLGVLRQLYELGVRYMTLTHNRTIDIADAATDTAKHGGLSPFGEQVVREMNRLGMLIDLSHVSHATMHDVLAVSEAPVIFSHSSAYAIVPHMRNVPDDILKQLGANGGVVMVSLIPRATNSAVNQWAAAEAAESARLTALYPGEPERVAGDLLRWRREHPVPATTLAQVADHIDHIRKTVGVEHIAIGSDLEGDRFRIVGMDTAAGFQELFAELARRGYLQAELKLISRGNILRVIREAENISARLRVQRGPNEQRLQ